MLGFSWPDGIKRPSLPIDDQLPEILEALKTVQVLVVKGALGSGKTTRIAPYVLLSGNDAFPAGKLPVILTLPRRNYVRWSGEFIAREMQTKPGEVVGWRLAGEEPVFSETNKLELMVTQALNNRIRKQGGVLPEGLIIVDEAHENSLETQLLLGLLKENISRSPKTKVIIASATIDAERFVKYFNHAHSIDVKGTCFPVETFVERLKSSEHHSQAACRVAKSIMRRFDESLSLIEGYPESKVTAGTIIVLLPGKADIKALKRDLEEEIRTLEGSKKFEVLVCHGESTIAEQDAVQTSVPEGVLRFVLGTEVLRASVTIQDAIGVIDTLQVKRFVCDEHGVGRLEKVQVSRREAEQGAGRAGRTATGFYVATSYETEYENLALDSIPATHSSPLTSTVLQLAAVGQSARDFAFLDPPDKRRLDVAHERLKRLGLIDQMEKITELGEKIVELPLQPEHAVALWTAKEMDVLAETAIVVSSLEQGNLFDVPEYGHPYLLVDQGLLDLIKTELDQNLHLGGLVQPDAIQKESVRTLPDWATQEADLFKVDCRKAVNNWKQMASWLHNLLLNKWSNGGCSDFVATVKAYREFKTKECSLFRGASGKRRPSRSKEQKLRRWAEMRLINWARLRQLEHTLNLVCGVLKNIDPEIQSGIVSHRNFSEEALSKSLLSGLFDQLGRRDSYGSFEGPLGKFLLKPGSLCPKTAKFVLVGNLEKENTGSDRTLLENKASLAAPIKVEWLLETAPQLLTKTPLGRAAYHIKFDSVLQPFNCRFLTFDLGRRLFKVENRKEAASIFGDWFLSHIDTLEGQISELVTKNRRYLDIMLRLQTQLGDEIEPLADPESYHNWLRKKLSPFCSLSELGEGLSLEITDKKPLFKLVKTLSERLKSLPIEL